MPHNLILHRRILIALAEFRSLETSATQYTIKTIVRINFWHLVYLGDSNPPHLERNPQRNKCVQSKENL